MGTQRRGYTSPPNWTLNKLKGKRQVKVCVWQKILVQCWRSAGKSYHLVIGHFFIYQGQNVIHFRESEYKLRFLSLVSNGFSCCITNGVCSCTDLSSISLPVDMQKTWKKNSAGFILKETNCEKYWTQQSIALFSMFSIYKCNHFPNDCINKYLFKVLQSESSKLLLWITL